MLDGFMYGLVVAFILSLFTINDMIIEVLQPYTQIVITDSHYYILFGIIGLVAGFLNKI